MSTLTEHLSATSDGDNGQNTVVMLDGALATELERRGANLADPLWSAKVLLEAPHLIGEVHRDYFDAGADVATTATYQASLAGFARRGLDAAAAEQLMRLAVSLAIDARDAFWRVPAHRVGRRRPWIAASVGPYGAFLADGSEYRGHYAASDTELAEFHRPRMRVLADSGADLFAFETIPSLREAHVLAELLEEMPGMSGWMSFSCRDDAHTAEGQSIALCASELAHVRGIVAIGVNCTRPEWVSSLLRALRSRTEKPLLAYPNSGETYDPSHKCWKGESTHKSLARFAREWRESGAQLIGGCCRTTPEDIREARAALLG